MYTEEEYNAKRTARYERLKGAAARAEEESAQQWETARKMADFIPFGQPILIGHHSERSDRNYRARIENKHRKGYELHKRAQELNSRIASMENDTAIYSDDPNALEKIDSKLESLLILQERYKAINAAHTKFLKNPASLDSCNLSESDKDLIKNYVPTYSWTPHPIAPYQLTNLSANIRTARKRAADVEKKQATPDKDEQINNIRVEWRASENRIRVYYPARVDMETFKELKRHGYRALQEAGGFSAYYNRNAAEYIANLRNAAICVCSQEIKK